MLTFFEVLDFMDASSRFLMWKVDLWALSILIIFVLPFAFFHSLVRYVSTRLLSTYVDSLQF